MTRPRGSEDLVPKTAIFIGKISRIFIGTPLRGSAYSWLRGDKTQYWGAKRIGEQTMRDTKDVLRIIGMLLLALFVVTVVAPLVFTAVGIAFSFAISLAVLLIKVAVVLAIGYLILVGVRALLR